MEKKHKNYFVKIYNKLLFDGEIVFRSRYTVWVYMILKLKYNYYIQHNPNAHYKIDTKGISEILHINRATVYDCIKELEKFILLDKPEAGLYKIGSENELVNAINKHMEEMDIRDEQFTKVYNNQLIELFSAGLKIREVEIYYYLLSNRDFTQNGNQFVKTYATQTSISRNLRMDHRNVKDALQKLIDTGYVLIENNMLFVNLPDYLDKAEVSDKTPTSVQDNVESDTSVQKASTQKSYETSEQTINYTSTLRKEPVYRYTEQNGVTKRDGELLGWYKSRDGMTESEIVKHPKYGIVLRGIRKANGIPPTEQEITKQDYIRTYGKEPEIDDFAL